jgi:hypothetical protein
LPNSANERNDPNGKWKIIVASQVALFRFPFRDEFEGTIPEKEEL